MTTEKICVVCENEIIGIDEAICEKCLKSPIKTKESGATEQFKKELRALFYHDVGDCHCLHPDEVAFFMERWGIWKK